MKAAPQTVDAYIHSFPPETRAILQALRATVLASVPGGQERLSYRMPAVFLHGVVVYYAAFKKHIGIFPPVEDPALRAKVAPYAGPKGNLQFPLSAPIPLDLIAEVVRARLAANVAKATAVERSPRAGAARRSAKPIGPG